MFAAFGRHRRLVLSILKEAKKVEWLSWDHSILPELLGSGMCDCSPMDHMWPMKETERERESASSWGHSGPYPVERSKRTEYSQQ